MSDTSELKAKSIVGCLLGTAVGDAMGLPFEGLSSGRIRRMSAQIDRYRFFLGKGMVSDDTEQTCMVAQALIVSGGEEKKFARAIAWRLRWWFLGLPAGVGMATLQACIKLWLGFPPHRSGVFSAGNGAAMRSGIIGVCYGYNRPKLRLLIKRCTQLTHCDPKAEWAALAVALAAYFASCTPLIEPEAYLQALQEVLEPEAGEFLMLMAKACESAAKGESGDVFAASLGQQKGVGGYVYRTVPVVVQVWLRYQEDYPCAISKSRIEDAIAEIIQLGGDTDTTAAILGGIIGASVGKEGIPSAWLENLWEFPRTVRWMEQLGMRLAEVTQTGISQPALPLAIYGILPRNLFFLFVVLCHGFRRLFPPY